jgi:acyl-coenzyme A synthetase/AMP-(fatty) acid ligase
MLATHPDILEVAVVAITDEKWGERPKAYITVKEGRGVDGKQVIGWAKHKSSISKFMVPAEVEVLEELPKTSTGKTKKVELRERARKSSKT